MYNGRLGVTKFDLTSTIDIVLRVPLPASRATSLNIVFFLGSGRFVSFIVWFCLDSPRLHNYLPLTLDYFQVICCYWGSRFEICTQQHCCPERCRTSSKLERRTSLYAPDLWRKLEHRRRN